MRVSSFRRSGFVLASMVFGLFSADALGIMNVVSVSPAPRALTVPIKTPISVTFDLPVNMATVNTQRFYVFGRWSGAKTGTFAASPDGMTVTFTPDQPFSAGEQVMVALSNQIQAMNGMNLRAAGYSYQFWTRVRPSSMTWSAMTPFSNRTGGAGGPQTRIYGAAGTDFNEDGFLDLCTVNEVSEDVRVFLNSADGQGNYDQPFLSPQTIGQESSPNEPADFNRDGHADLATAAANGSEVTILLGNGTGVFTSTQFVTIPAGVPHGMAVLDTNGDAAMDIATANTASDNISLLINNGSGVFAAPISIPTGGNDDYALSAGDMNNDGILDLVVGTISSQEFFIMRNNGNNTFTQFGPFPAGGNIWMVTLGDVNGDGNMDVAGANGPSSTGSILLGNGALGLGAPTTYSPPFSNAIATDLGDLDGDGDLDWELSFFGGPGGWRVMRNNGAGVFTTQQDFSAISNSSCSVLLDIDNDRDMDLAQTDEIADMVTIQKNSGSSPLGDFNNDNDVDMGDFTAFSACYAGPGVLTPLACGHGDFDGDGDCDCDDHEAFQTAWTAGGTPPELPQCATGPIPTVSTWGVIMVALLLTASGTIVMRRRVTD